MGNCGTREESAVVSTAQVQQQLHIISSSASIKNGQSDKKHSRSVSDLSDPTSTPRNFEDSRKNALLYTHVIAFTLYELETITKSFRSDYILGEGGFGTVYKGYIDENVRVGLKSLPVAVKVLNKEGLQGHREWLTEVNFLGQLRHPHLVKLIGYCCEDDHRLLVYEFMFRGSLENHLFRKATVPLSWATRMMIALGAAKGLAFLHNAERPVIYRDFKTSNILLDSDYTAKLSDFGLAKAGPQGDETHVSTRVMGTYGYAAPEYVMTVPRAACEVSSSLTPALTGGAVAFAMGGVPDYRMRHRFTNNVGPGSSCRSPNPNCSPACKHSSLSVVYSSTEMNYSMKLAVLVIFLFIPGQLIISPVQPSPVNTSLTAGEFRPMEPAEYRLIGRKGDDHDDDLWRRRLAPFQLCLLCKCCAGAATTNCATMPCCFGIDCQLPNKPYGVCAFVPKTCNCTSCATV
ncbi:hypothetical protein D5086_012745 [Populus alba]|uniref:Uncharacterized protein n=1 Tax=Populus alba TaxID=43335 RepID=A0ACC4C3S2_POPAL